MLSSAAHFSPYPAAAGGPVRLDSIDSPEGYNLLKAYVRVLLPWPAGLQCLPGGMRPCCVRSIARHYTQHTRTQALPPAGSAAAAAAAATTVTALQGQSKLCNLLFARELHRRLSADGAPVIAVACHPGVIITELGRHLEKQMHWAVRLALTAALSWSFKSIPQGAATQTYLATAPGVKGGEYYADVNISASTAASHDDVLGAALWELSERLTATNA